MNDRRKDVPYDGELDDEATFEKIRKQTRPLLPTGNRSRARRSAKETPASRKVRKTVSSKGGIHRRRQKKVE